LLVWLLLRLLRFRVSPCRILLLLLLCLICDLGTEYGKKTFMYRTLPIFLLKKKEGEEEVSQPKDISQMKTELEKLAHVLDTRGWGKLAEETEGVEEEPLPGEEYEEEEAEEEETPAKEPEKAEPKISDKELGKERKAKIKEWHKVKKEVEKELEAAAIPTEKPAIRPAEEKMPEAKEVLPTEPEIKPEAAQKQTPPPKVPEPPIARKAEEVQFKQTPAPPKPPQAAPAQKKILPAPLPEKVLPAPSRLSRARQVKRQVAQTISQMEKGIAKKAVEQKEMIKKFKSTVSEIEKIFQKPPKPNAPKKLEVNIIPSVSLATGTPTEETKKEPYLEEYKINLGNRITTPRVSEPATNIRVDETRLEDVLEGAQKMKTLKKELKEVGVAMEKQRHKKKPHIIKSGESIVGLEKKEE